MRTTEADVRLIISTTILTGQVDAFILSANLFVTNHLGSTTLDAYTLKDIERWIAAHMIAMTFERVARKEEAGSAKVEYVGEFAKGLKQTMYGQTAIELDSTGTLDTLADGNKPISIQAL